MEKGLAFTLGTCDNLFGGPKWTVMDKKWSNTVNLGSVEHPRGIYPARIDEKGRLKLPADFHRYLTEIGATRVFVTSFDERIGRIYPIPVWKQVVATFE